MAGAVDRTEDEEGSQISRWLGIDGYVATPGWLTPARQFHIVLGVTCMLSALVISLSASLLIQRFVFGETRDLTSAGVEMHFRAAFGDDIFLRPLSPTELHRLDQMVRPHFDVFNIVQVKFYKADGRITYSYTPSLIDNFSLEGEISPKLQTALTGEVVMSHEGLSEADNDRGRDFPDVFEIYVPIRRDGQVVGVAEVYRDVEQLLVNVRYMQGFIVSSVSAVSLFLYLSLRRVYHRSTERIALQSVILRKALREIELTTDQTLETLSAAIDGRDAETEGHSRRVTEFALTIARRLEISRSDLEDLARGALLHDTGKLSVSDSILLKPGPLTPDEWVEMRKHAEAGYRMLAQIAFLRGALPVVLHHHERFDGGGYPAGLKGDQIPRLARVFAVADALDAMISDRPYRRALSFAAARQEIVSQSGRQFDPSVVEAFAAVQAGEWEAIVREIAAKRGNLWGVLQSGRERDLAPAMES